MTTNKEALQKIFEAALKEPEPQPNPTARMRSRATAENYGRTRSYGEPVSTAPMQRAAETVRNEATFAEAPTRNTPQAEVTKPASIPTKTKTTNELAATEPSGNSDQKAVKDKGRWKLQWLLTSIAITCGIGGGILWLIQSPEKSSSIQSAATEVQIPTELQSIASTGKESFDEAVALSNQSDQAASVLNISNELPVDQNVAMEETSSGLTGNEVSEK